MCGTCGCGSKDGGLRIYLPKDQEGNHEHEHSHEHQHGGVKHSHPHAHQHSHQHDHDHSHGDTDIHLNSNHDHTHEHEIAVEQDILHRNDMMAARNRGYFEALRIRAINLVSSPGSGKTTLLEKSIAGLLKTRPVYVIEGDQQTSRDADRIQATGAPVVQINTGNGCHLDANMVKTAIEQLKPEQNALLFIENVGNLVCPAMFDLGENQRVVIISVTEGEDKPLKYPNMFQTAQLCVINKTDLLPYLSFDIDLLKENALKVNHHLQFIEVSAQTGEGLDQWLSWLSS